MKTERQRLLLRRMRRSLIALRIQTPQPVLYRIPRRWYFSVVAVLLALTALISTRAALLFRAEVEVTQARVVYVQKANLDRGQARIAALIDYQQRPKYEEAQRVSEPEPEAVLAKVVKQPEEKKASAKRSISPEAAQIVISSRYVEAPLPLSIEGAFRRLTRAEDPIALNWLLSRSGEFQYDPAWERFQQATSTADSSLRAYQVGVLFGAAGDDHKSYRWSASAAALSDRPLYIRAYAVAADRLGKREEAARAYRRYLAMSPAGDFSQIAERLAVLESP